MYRGAVSIWPGMQVTIMDTLRYVVIVKGSPQAKLRRPEGHCLPTSPSPGWLTYALIPFLAGTWPNGVCVGLSNQERHSSG